MLNNLINFFNLRQGRAVKTSTEPDDVLILGVPDKSFDGGYKPVMIKVKDFGGGLTPGSNIDVCNINLTPIEATLGTPVDFETLDGQGLEDTIVPGVLRIARGDTQSIYNSFTEGGYVPGVSPDDTEWNSSFTDGVLNGFGTLTNLGDRTYDTFVAACNNAVGLNVIGLELVCHVISTNQYFLFVFDAWTSFGAEGGAGFGYIRTEVFISEPCEITFSDGTKMRTAADVDTNTWDMSTVAFVDSINGNDATAVVGNGNKPFLNINSALFSSSKVWVNPGTYNYVVNIPTYPETFMHCPTGVVFGSGSQINDSIAFPRIFNLSGNAIFNNNSNGIASSGQAIINVNCDKFDDVRTVLFNFGAGTVNLTCNTVLANCFNGGAYAMSSRSTSKTSVIVKHSFRSQHFVAFIGAGFTGEFYYECPDTRVIQNYTSPNNYGTTAKGVWTFDNVNGGTIEIVSDCTIDQQTVGANSAIFFVNNLLTNGGQTITYKGNMRIEPTASRGLSVLFRAVYGTIKCIGNELISAGSPVTNQLTGYAGAANMKISLTGYRVEAPLSIEVCKGTTFIGNKCSFYNSQVLATAKNFTRFNIAGVTNDATLYLYNCIGEVQGASAEFIDATYSVSTVGIISTVSNKALGAGVVDTFGGHTVLAGLITPKF